MLQLKYFSILANYNQGISSLFTAYTASEPVCFCFVFRLKCKEEQTILF